MERLYDLHFELSNEDRLSILQLLKERQEKLTRISKEIQITTQQCIRHLNRLVGAGMVTKTGEGLYRLTPFGEISLKLNRGFSFIAQNRDHFLTHTLDKLPDQFVARIGDLTDSWLTPDVMVSIGEFESIIREADDFIWVIIDQRTPSVRPLIARAVERGVKIRSLSLIKRENYGRAQRDLDEADERIILKSFREEQAVAGDLDDSGIYLYMSEKAAFVAFPSEDGSFDYLGFSSTDTRAISLCVDMFNYYWDRAYIIPIIEMVERSVTWLKSQGINIE